MINKKIHRVVNYTNTTAAKLKVFILLKKEFDDRWMWGGLLYLCWIFLFASLMD